jgi:hypothetical protein
VNDPVDILRNFVEGYPEAVPGSFQLLADRSWELGHIYLYQFQARRQHTLQRSQILKMSNHMIFIYGEMGELKPLGGGGGGSDPDVAPSPDQRIELAIGCGALRDQGSYAYALGRVLSWDVAGVEVVFEDGQTLRDDAADGYFALVAAEAGQAVQLRVLDAKGETIELIDLKESFPMPPHPDAAVNGKLGDAAYFDFIPSDDEGSP